jgi:hypothetical protein
MRKKTLLLIAVLCALVALLIGLCYPSDYDDLRPTRMGTVSIPEIQMTISLFSKPRPRAGMIAPYEGEYRILEIAQRDKPPLYYALPGTIPADMCHFEVFWYPRNNLIRFRDSGFTFDAQFRSEAILDLDKRILYSVVRHKDRVYMAKRSTPMSALAFPKRDEKSRVASSSSISTSTSSGSPDPVVQITVGDEDALPVDASWTKETGALVGTIAPKGTQ